MRVLTQQAGASSTCETNAGPTRNLSAGRRLPVDHRSWRDGDACSRGPGRRARTESSGRDSRRAAIPASTRCDGSWRWPCPCSNNSVQTDNNRPNHFRQVIVEGLPAHPTKALWFAGVGSHSFTSQPTLFYYTALFGSVNHNCGRTPSSQTGATRWIHLQRSIYINTIRWPRWFDRQSARHRASQTGDQR